MKGLKNPHDALWSRGKESGMQTAMETGYLLVLCLPLQVLFMRHTILIN